MASNHTTNYNLNQWEATDKVLRTDFNADNAKIDAALKANADAIDTLETQLVSGLAGKGNCQIELKTYTGSGTSGSSYPTQISFSTPPTVVLIFGYRGMLLYRVGDTLATIGHSTSSGTGVISIECTWSGTTMSFYGNSEHAQMNVSGRSYCVLAFYALDET